MDEKATKPEYDKLRERERTRQPSVFLTIRDAGGEVVRRLPGSTRNGVHRTDWDLRYGGVPGRGPFVIPGTYTVTVSKQVGGELTDLSAAEPIEVEHLALGTIQPEDREAVRAFHRQVAELHLAVQSTGRAMAEAEEQLSAIERAVFDSLGADQGLTHQAHDLLVRLRGLRELIEGDDLPGRFNEPTLPGIRERVQYATATWGMTAPPTQAQRLAYDDAAEAFADVLEQVRTLLNEDVPALQQKLDEAGVLWTPGRLPSWRR
jgi:hypothetical protein